MGKAKYNWKEIQKYCGNRIVSGPEIQKKFGMTPSAITYAIKRGDLSIRRYEFGSNARYDWAKIQKDINRGLTIREVSLKYGCSVCSVDEARKRVAIKTKNRSQAMVISNKKHPRKHSQKTKDKISRIRKCYLKKHPDQIPYVLNHYSKGDSYPERYFKRLFKRENINLKRDYNVGTYWLDFASLNNKIDIEVDGNQHRDDPRIVKHDKDRTRWLTSNGWKVFRVFWSDYQKKSMVEKKKVIAKIRKLVS